MRPFHTIWDHLEPFGTIWDHLGPFGTIWDYLTIWDLSRRQIVSVMSSSSPPSQLCLVYFRMNESRGKGCDKALPCQAPIARLKFQGDVLWRNLYNALDVIFPGASLDKYCNLVTLEGRGSSQVPSAFPLLASYLQESASGHSPGLQVSTTPLHS